MTSDNYGQETAIGIVRGRVQGVWFRAFTREQALQRGLTGYARNQPDGSVAFALSGDRAAIEEVIAALRQGPPMAQVTALEVCWSESQSFAGFATG